MSLWKSKFFSKLFFSRCSNQQLHIICLEGSTNQAYSCCNFFKIAWKLMRWLKNILNPDFWTPNFNPRLLTHELFNPGLFNHEFLNRSWLKILGLKSPGLKCILSIRLKDISTLNFSNPDFSAINFSTPWFNNSWLKKQKKNVGHQLCTFPNFKYNLMTPKIYFSKIVFRQKLLLFFLRLNRELCI